MELKGVFAPATTPFDPVTGDVDVIGFRRNARAWLDAPLAGLVLFGTTGEGLLVDEEERARSIGSLREIAADRLLLAGTGAESTRATIRLTRSAAEAGADAVLVQPPAYYRPQLTPEALRDHFTAVADASPVPVVLYQVPPAYSGIDLVSGLVAELSRHENIVGIKDSTGDLKTLGSLVETCGAEFQVMVGSGGVFYGALEVGACGGILGVAVLAPHDTAEIQRLRDEGLAAEAGALQERITPVHKSIIGGLGVPGVKAALDMLGMVGGPPRAPLKPLREKERAIVREALEKAGLLEVGVA